MNLFFNASMPRSGSELLQVLLHQNPTIYGSPTSPLLEFQYAARGNLGLPEVRSQDQTLMLEAFNSLCQGMAQSYYAPITNRENVIDKNRGWSHYYEWVAQWNPEPKMVCMVRDLRGILASMENIYCKNRHLPVGPDNPKEMQNMTVEQRVAYWLNTQPVGLALQRTQDLFQKNIDDKVLFIKLEDLIANPQDELDRWYEFAGLPKYQHTFDSIAKTVVEDDRFYGVYGDHKIKSTIEPLSDWSKIYPRDVSDKIYDSATWYFETFNYKRKP